MAWYEEKHGCIMISVKVIPRAAKDSIQGIMGDELKIRIQAPPVDGRANVHLIRFLSKHWGIARDSIEIVSGLTGRRKRIRILNPPDGLLDELNNIA